MTAPIETKDVVSLMPDWKPTPHKCEYFQDDREGTDRWGTPYKQKIGCGPSLEDACPAYLEESCPGCKNKGNRIDACQMQACDGECGECGGGNRSTTIAYCGQSKSLYRDVAHAEFSDSLRLDTYITDQSGEPELPFPVNWFPVVEVDRNDTASRGKGGEENLGGTWMEQLGEVPMVGTTVKTPWDGFFSERGRIPLRKKLGISDKTTLILNGLSLDNTLDEVWDDRRAFMEAMLEDGVDVMITPQFSAYPSVQNYMALYNANRVMQWHVEAVEMGFKHVVMQHPGAQAMWLLDEYQDFIGRSGVKLVAFNAQLGRRTGTGYDTEALRYTKMTHDAYPKDIAWIVFGPSTYQAVAQTAAICKGRRLLFANVNAYASSVFFQLYPTMRKAPAGWSKGQCFKHNCETFLSLTDKVLATIRA
jgi:hypothetical protein